MYDWQYVGARKELINCDSGEYHGYSVTETKLH